MLGSGNLHSRKLTWKPKKGRRKTTVLLKGYYMGFHISLGECNRKLPGGAFLSQTHCTFSLCILAEIINQEKLHGWHVVTLGLSEDALVAGSTEQHIHELGTTQKGESAFPAGLDLVHCLIQNKFPDVAHQNFGGTSAPSPTYHTSLCIVAYPYILRT